MTFSLSVPLIDVFGAKLARESPPAPGAAVEPPRPSGSASGRAAGAPSKLALDTRRVTICRELAHACVRAAVGVDPAPQSNERLDRRSYVSSITTLLVSSSE